MQQWTSRQTVYGTAGLLRSRGRNSWGHSEKLDRQQGRLENRAPALQPCTATKAKPTVYPVGRVKHWQIAQEQTSVALGYRVPKRDSPWKERGARGATWKLETTAPWRLEDATESGEASHRAVRHEAESLPPGRVPSSYKPIQRWQTTEQSNKHRFSRGASQSGISRAP